jgi:non-specific serine/threonine protein kinase
MLPLSTGKSIPLNAPSQFGNYKVTKAIAKGSTCAVVEVVDLTTNNDYAVKVVSSNDMAKNNQTNQFNNEMEILQSLNHKYIAHLVEIVQQGDLTFCVMENCHGGNLLSHHFTEKKELLRIFKEIVDAIEYLHDKGIAHGDIKPENVMLNNDGNVKIVDFGFAKRDLMTNEKNGTLVYAAPELLKYGSYETKKADIWSLGILLFVMATQQIPYAIESCDTHSVAKLIRQGKLTFPMNLDSEIEHLIRKMTMLNPNRRPTIHELAENKVFESIETKVNELRSTVWQ